MKYLAWLCLLLVTSSAFAQSPTYVRGTITSLRGDVLAVKSRDGKDLRLQLAPDLGVATAKATTLAELKGKYVGVTAMSKDGRMVALEVHELPPQAKPGHTPWDLEPGSTMTNANTPVVTFVPGSRAELKPGEYIWTAARQEADGKLFAQRVSVSKDGVKPPH